MNEMQAQCWICPTCHDDHQQGAACTPPSERCGEEDLYRHVRCEQNKGHAGPHVTYESNGTYAWGW